MTAVCFPYLDEIRDLTPKRTCNHHRHGPCCRCDCCVPTATPDIARCHLRCFRCRRRRRAISTVSFAASFS